MGSDIELQALNLQLSRLFDHLVGTEQDRRRQLDAESLGSLEVEHGFVFGRQLDRQVGRLLALVWGVDCGSCRSYQVGTSSRLSGDCRKRSR
jgi:hypothetical protein